MSAQMMGYIGILFGLNSVYQIFGFNSITPISILEFFQGPDILIRLVMQFIFAVVAYYLGRQASNGGFKSLGALGVVLGLMGILIVAIHIFDEILF